MAKKTAKKEKPAKQEALITGDMIISDIVRKYPEAAEVFINYGLHCIGCHVSAWETLEQGAKGHGMDDETIARMVKDANNVALAIEKGEKKAKKQPEKGLTITDSAVDMIKEGMKKNNRKGNFRIAVLPGPVRLSYHFCFDEKKHRDDTVIEKSGLTVLVDERSMALLDGAKIDYAETLQGVGFKITNPNAKGG